MVYIFTEAHKMAENKNLTNFVDAYKQGKNTHIITTPFSEIINLIHAHSLIHIWLRKHVHSHAQRPGLPGDCLLKPKKCVFPPTYTPNVVVSFSL